MKKSLLELYYNAANYEPMSGGGYGISNSKPNSVLGKQTAGRTKQIHIYDIEDSSDEDLDDDEIDDIDISSKLGTSSYVYKSDLGNRKDNATLANNNHTSIFEISGNHTTHAAKGLSPRITYRSNTNTKGPAFGVQSNAPYIKSGPSKKTGTPYGTSRASKLANDDEGRVFNLEDVFENDPMERSFKKQQNKIKEVLMIINEYLFSEIQLKPLR